MLASPDLGAGGEWQQMHRSFSRDGECSEERGRYIGMVSVACRQWLCTLKTHNLAEQIKICIGIPVARGPMLYVVLSLDAILKQIHSSFASFVDQQWIRRPILARPVPGDLSSEYRRSQDYSISLLSRLNSIKCLG